MGHGLWTFLVSGPGLWLRIGVGAAILAGMAWVDWRRHGATATRWREYCFLMLVVGVALLYGVINDQITSRISWEYYYFGKGLAEALGPEIPPAEGPLSWEAAKVGMKATWSAGLLIGVALLIANNPRRGRPALRSGVLIRQALGIMGVAVMVSAVLGVVGWLGWFSYVSEDFRMMLQHDEMRPRRFMAVFGIHLGGYLGGLLGTVLSVAWILRRRGRSATGNGETAAPPGLHPGVGGPRPD